MSSNPCVVYWMGIFHMDLLQNCNLWKKRLKINEKEAGVSPFKIEYNLFIRLASGQSLPKPHLVLAHQVFLLIFFSGFALFSFCLFLFKVVREIVFLKLNICQQRSRKIVKNENTKKPFKLKFMVQVYFLKFISRILKQKFCWLT